MTSDATPTSLATSFGGSFLPGPWRFVPLALVVVLGAVGWSTHVTIEGTVKQKLAEGLTTILEADVTALEEWMHAQINAASILARQDDVRDRAAALAGLGTGDRRLLLDAPEAAELPEAIGPHCSSHGHCGFALIHPDGKVLASDRDELVGTDVVKGNEDCQRVLAGEAIVTRPFKSLVSLPDHEGIMRANWPTMFVGVPILVDGEVVAGLGLRLHPDSDFTRILNVGRAGESGETYAFDDEGLMLSQSRFDDQLKSVGLLPDDPGVRSILNLHVRDPGVDMVAGGRPELLRSEQPLTRMAELAISGTPGVDVDGYRDYRGVEVVGAWTWLPEHGFGVVTEIDAAEGFAGLGLLRRAFLIIFGLLVLTAVAMLFSSRLVVILRRRVKGAMRKIEQLGQYTLEEKIGEGGMGIVYRARHALLRRPTALKLLPADRAGESEVRRFEHEVQLTSRLTHPNTIAVYDYGHTPDGVFYYAMELLDGMTLRQVVSRTGPLPEARVIHVLRQACGSLAEAHAMGMIHRDIKPANIFLCERGGIPDTVKVLDFGLVKDVRAVEVTQLTQSNAIAGTPGYLAPELIDGVRDIDGRLDIYALGVVGYFLLAGREPFTGESLTELLGQHLTKEPMRPSARLGRDVADDLETIVMECLAKDRDDRPASCEELESRLGACRDAGGWTRDDARRWWAQHGPEGGSRAESGGATETVVVEIAER